MVSILSLLGKRLAMQNNIFGWEKGNSYSYAKFVISWYFQLQEEIAKIIRTRYQERKRSAEACPILTRVEGKQVRKVRGNQA